MATSILSSGVPITFVILLLAFGGSCAHRSPIIHRAMRDLTPNNTGANDTQAKVPLAKQGINGEAGVNVGVGSPWVNAGVNAGAGVSTNAIGQAVAGFGSALSAGVGGVLTSAANVIASPWELVRPFLGGGNTSPALQLQQSSDSGKPNFQISKPFSFFGPHFGKLPIEKCNALWREAILREVMNYDNWRCSSRSFSIEPQTCVLTGSVETGLSLGVITTGCGWKMPLFCDDSINVIVSGLQATTMVPTPPAGYTYVAGVGTFKVHTEAENWDDAEAACVREGAHLAVPSSADDYSTIQTMFTASLGDPDEGGWVGISDIAVEENFVTVTGQPVCTLEQILFGDEEPNNGGLGGSAENCLVFGEGQGGRLNDAHCTDRLPFICEIILPSRRTPCRSALTG